MNLDTLLRKRLASQIACLNKFGLEAQHPDEFIQHHLDISVPKVGGAAPIVRERLDRPALSVEEYLNVLLKAKLVRTVKVLRENNESLG